MYNIVHWWSITIFEHFFYWPSFGIICSFHTFLLCIANCIIYIIKYWKRSFYQTPENSNIDNELDHRMYLIHEKNRLGFIESVHKKQWTDSVYHRFECNSIFTEKNKLYNSSGWANITTLSWSTVVFPERFCKYIFHAF